ncbi:MAG: glutathione ABC transporter substrate-binding protein [Pseudomonadota bacterium]
MAGSLGAFQASQAAEMSIALNQIVQGLNPQDSNYNVDYSVANGIFERLIAFDGDMKLVPQLATSWEGSEDAKVFTLKLRQGVKFQDGTDFNAAAVKFNLDRLADPDLNLKKHSLFKLVESVETPDENTVVIKLSKPFGAMINTLAHPSIVMQSPTAIEKYGKDIAKHPVGTGPFKFEEWVPGEKLVVVKNEGYWDPEWPKLDKVTFYPVAENGTRVSMLMSDEVQFVPILPAELMKRVSESDTYEVLEKPGISVWVMAMNMMREQFQDIRVREAFNLAIDQQAFGQVVYGGHAIVPDAPLAPATQFHATQSPALSTDVARAKELMKEAGYENGFEVNLWARNNSTEVRMLQFLKQQLSQINVNVQIVPLEGATRAEKLFGANLTPETAEFDMTIGGWSPSTGDADWHLRPVYSTEGFVPNMYNLAFYSNAIVDKAVQDALETADPAKRAAAYAIAQEQIWKDKPVVWLAVDNALAGRKKGLTGAFPMPDGTMQYARAAYEE